MNKLNKIYIIALTVFIALAMFGCRGNVEEAGTEVGEGVSGECQIKGSDTLLMLSQRWAEDYMADNPNAIIQVTGGGSGVGIAALIDDTTDVANASRPIKDKEIEECAANGVDVLEIAVAKDGISLIVNKDNPIKDLSLAQLKDIYTGKVKNWKEVGGDDAQIICYGRQSSSGTYDYFKKNVLDKEDYRTDVQELTGNSLLCDSVSKDKNGIAYVGIGYALKRDDIAIVGVSTETGGDSIVPTISTVGDGSYQITRYLFNYTNGKPEGVAKAYIEFALSDEGQRIVEEVEYVALPQDMLEENRAKLNE